MAEEGLERMPSFLVVFLCITRYTEIRYGNTRGEVHSMESKPTAATAQSALQSWLETRMDWAGAAQFGSLSVCAGIAGALGLVLGEHVFANAQTGNLLGLAFDVKAGNWPGALARLGAVALYLAGIVMTVRMPQRVFHGKLRRWQCCCLLIETALFALQAFLPWGTLAAVSPALALWPVFFASALQYNTFNIRYGVGVSTLFSTNNLRQLALHGLAWRDSGSRRELRIMGLYGTAVAGFWLGALAGLFLCDRLGARAMLFCAAITLANWAALVLTAGKTAPAPPVC